MQTVAIKDLKNSTKKFTNCLQNSESIFITKEGNLIGVTIPLNDEIENLSLKELLYFNLYKQNQISFGKLAEFLKIDKPTLRKKFTSINMSVIDYNPKDVKGELEVLDKYL